MSATLADLQRDREQELFPLSEEQTDFWFGQKLSPEMAWYNVAGYSDFAGPVDPDLFAAAVQHAFDDIETLRLVIVETEQGPRQLALPRLVVHTPFVDLAGEADPHAAAMEWMQADASKLFDLARGPLARYALLRLAPDHFFGLSVKHHLITDAFSTVLVERHIEALYNWLVRGGARPRNPPASALRLIEEDKAYRLSGRQAQDRLFWLAELANRPYPATLSGQRPIWSGRVVRSNGVLPRAAADALDYLGRACGTGLAAVILAAVAVYLARLTGARDLILGMLVANRPSPTLRNIAGHRSNILPLRLLVDVGATFADLQRQAGRRVREGLRHQRYSGSALRRDLGISPDQPDLYGMLVNLVPIDNQLDFAGAPGWTHALPNERASDLFLTVLLGSAAQDVRVVLSANAAHYAAEEVEAHLRGLIHLLGQVACAPDDQQKLCHLPLMPAMERSRILEGLNSTAADFPSDRLIHQLFEAQSAANPDAVAAVFEDRHVSYGALNARANQVAHRLLGLGVRPDDRVAICIERSLEMVAGLLGVLKAGAAYVPLDPAYPAERLDFMLKDSAPAALLTQRTMLGRWQAKGIATGALDDADYYAGMPDHNPNHDTSFLTPRHLAYVMYTSGSTGQPKAVMVEHRQVCNQILALISAYGLTAQDRVLQFNSLSFDAAVEEIFGSLSCGARLALARTASSIIDAEEIARLCERHKLTVISLPTQFWRHMLETTTTGFPSSVRLIVVGGDALSLNAVTTWLRNSKGPAKLLNTYGPTEATVVATIFEPHLGALNPISIGRPISNARIYILDSVGEPVPCGTAGEIHIGGAGVARGYLNRPELTAERFLPDRFALARGEHHARMYKTGDIGRWLADGTIEFLGRNDFQVKIRGFRIELGEIEARLAACPEVRDAVVVAREDTPGDQRLVAYVTAEPGAAPAASSLRSQLAAVLPDYMVPTAFVTLDALPLAPNGKLDRKALPEPGHASVATRAYEAPIGNIEGTLAAIWQDLLGVERVGRNDHFFELGGHSLSALRVAARLRDRYKLDVPLKTLFEAPTLMSLAARVDAALQAPPGTLRFPPIPAGAAGRLAPLSYSQERMWIIQSMTPATTAYNIPVALRLAGRMDVAALCTALDALLHRHDILHSVIRPEDGRLVQEVLPTRGPSLTVIDLRGRGEAAEGDAMEAAHALAKLPFDLARENVIKLCLYRLTDDLCILLVILHHVAADQWSFGVLGRDLAELYNGCRSGSLPLLEPLAVSYRDYALWQRNLLQGPEAARQLAYWRRRLEDVPELVLPTDHSYPALPSLAGAICRMEIPPSLIALIDGLNRRTGSTLFMTMLAAFAVLLHRLSGQTDLPIGVPVANRTQTATERLVGTFVNTLVLRLDLAGNPTFTQLLKRVQGIALEAFSHQDIPFDWLVREIQQRRGASRAPLVQVMFNVNNAPTRGIDFAGLDWTPVILDRGGAQFELSFLVDPEISRELIVEYNSDLFDRVTIERFVTKYFLLLYSACEAPATPVRGLALLPQSEIEMLRAWNTTDSPRAQDKVFPDLFRSRATASPGAPAISFAGETLSYAQLDARSDAVALRLQSLNVGPGVLVGLCVPRSLALPVALLGVLKSGGAYVPLDPAYPPQRLDYMLADSGAKVLLTANGCADRLAVPDGVAVLDLATVAEAEAHPRYGSLASPGPQDIAYVIYTSGSTGQPKGVAVPHGALVNFLLSVQQRPGLAATDVLAAVTTISFDIAGLELYLPLMVGARIELVTREVASDGRALAAQLAASGATVLQATPATWRMLLEAGWKGAPGFRAFCGGEALSRDLADALLPYVGELWNLYGPTETTIWSTLDQVKDDGAPISIGRPIANTSVHVLDQDGAPVPIGIVGEICIGGAGVALGYLGRPGLTAERFIADAQSSVPGARLYRTGDLGRWSPDGRLMYLGRLDQQVKINGFRIETGEIESVLNAHPSVRQAVVVAREAQPGNQRLVAYLVYHDGEDLTASDVRRYLRQTLPEFMIPAFVVSVAAMPMTLNGKIDRNALPDPFKAALRAVVTREPPSPGLEQMMAEIWQSVLGVDKVFADDNFFELGGHSLLSLRVALAVEQRTGRPIDPRVLFFQSLRQVAAMAGNAASGVGMTT